MPVTFFPSIKTWPRVGRSIPAMIRNKDVLPASVLPKITLWELLPNSKQISLRWTSWATVFSMFFSIRLIEYLWFSSKLIVVLDLQKMQYSYQTVTGSSKYTSMNDPATLFSPGSLHTLPEGDSMIPQSLIKTNDLFPYTAFLNL